MDLEIIHMKIYMHICIHFRYTVVDISETINILPSPFSRIEYSEALNLLLGLKKFLPCEFQLISHFDTLGGEGQIFARQRLILWSNCWLEMVMAKWINNGYEFGGYVDSKR